MSNVMLKGIESLKKLGRAVTRGANQGIEKISYYVENWLKTVPPKTVSETVVKEREVNYVDGEQVDKYKIGSKKIVQEKEGAKEQKNKCTTHEFRFVNIRVSMGTNDREYLEQAKADILRSGLAKQMVVESILEHIRRII